MSEKPSAKLTREEAAALELGHTTITPCLAKVLVLVFLGAVLLIPLVQQAIDLRHASQEGKSGWPQAFSIFPALPETWKLWLSSADKGLYRRILSTNGFLLKRIQDYEKELEDHSFLAEYGIPRMQALYAKYLGLGNEQAYLGRDGWLFYRPELDYLAGPSFLDSHFQKRRAMSGDASIGNAVQPDPLKAIVDFHRQLEARGIRLILMPAPVKPVIEPGQLSGRYMFSPDKPVQNPSYLSFLEELKKQGIDVLDVSELLLENKKVSGESQFLKTDTHWTPQAMEKAAAALANKINALGMIESKGALAFTRSDSTIKGTGDIAAMLKLLPGEDLYPVQEVRIQAVKNADDSQWSADHNAAVLLLGDSFSNIYSLEAMGWGASAGFAEQLSFHLKSPVDTILRNDAGAYATRELLAKELSQGHDRLAGKKVVVWEFAMRELAVGDWKMIPLKEESAKAGTTVSGTEFYVPVDGAEPIAVEATVLAVSKVPRPGSVPYKDQIFSVHLGSISAGNKDVANQAMVYLFGMKDNVLSGPSSWKAGDKVKLRLSSWNDVAGQYDRFNRSELDDPDLQLETPCWGQVNP